MFKPLAVRFYLGLGAIAIFFIIMEMVVGRLFPSLFNISAAAFLTAGFTLTAFIALLIFFNGYHSDPGKKCFYDTNCTWIEDGALFCACAAFLSCL